MAAVRRIPPTAERPPASIDRACWDRLRVGSRALPFTEPMMAIITTASGLQYEDVRVGQGAAARFGADVVVHYTGWLTDGTKFDSSRDRNEPFGFALGQGNVIAGWEEGLTGMRVGGLRKLTVPPSLGYGAWGAGDVIPPDATLVFEVELLAVD
jgi:FKBP-type peptidyl-prolyl cis-trans isomerase FkpA